MKKRFLFCFLLLFYSLIFVDVLEAGYTGAVRNVEKCSLPELTSDENNNGSPSFSSKQYLERAYQPPDTTKPDGTKVTPPIKWIPAEPVCDTTNAYEVDSSKRHKGSGISDWKVYGESVEVSGYNSGVATINIYWDYEVDVYITYDGADLGSGISNGTMQTNAQSPNVKSNRNPVKKTYVDISMPVLKCKALRANNTHTDCSGNVSESEDKEISTKYRLMCFYYFSEYTNDGDSECYERAYVTKVLFDENLKDLNVYPGFQHPLSCTAHFGDNTKKVLNHNNNEFNHHVYYMPATPIETSFVGNAGQEDAFAYKYNYESLSPADQFYLKPEFRNYFLSHDSGDNSYVITCAYYSTEAFAKEQYKPLNVPIGSRATISNLLFSDADSNGTEEYNKVQTHEITVHNKGISKMELIADGYFAKHDKDESTIELEKKKFNLENHKDYFTKDYFFTAGHFYDFFTILTFSDGKTADVTNHPFVSYNTDLWYDGTPNNNPTPNPAGCLSDHDCLSALPNKPPEVWYSGFPRVGSKHRIPFNIENVKPVMFVSTQYLNNDAFLKTFTANRAGGKTHLRGLMKIREVIDFNIHESDESGNITELPKDKILVIESEEDEQRNFAAIVKYNNGDVENWTNTVTWSRDFNKKKGSPVDSINPKYLPFDFTGIKDNHRHISLFADIVNKEKYLLDFDYFRYPADTPQGLSNEVQTAFNSKISFSKNEGPNFEWYHDEQIIRLIDCRLDEADFNNLAFGCEPAPAPYKVTIKPHTPTDYSTEDLPEEMKEKLKEQIHYTFEFSNDTPSLTLPSEMMNEEHVQSHDETLIFYDYREFPVSGMSGSVGDN